MIKKLLIILCFFLASLQVKADDTSLIQGLVNAGNTVLPFRAYIISSAITLPHNLDCNGSPITYNNTTGHAFTMSTAGVKISNGSLTGLSDVENSSGSGGISITADNCTVDHMTISTFTGVGILGGNANNETVTNNTVNDIGYIGIFLISNVAINGGTVAFNTIDRSMLAPTAPSQGAMLIRGAVGQLSNGWSVHDNVIKMPINPMLLAAEFYEHRYSNFCNIYHNTFIGGTIGASIVECTGIRTYYNDCSKQRDEAIEYANSYFGAGTSVPIKWNYNILNAPINESVLPTTIITW